MHAPDRPRCGQPDSLYFVLKEKAENVTRVPVSVSRTLARHTSVLLGSFRWGRSKEEGMAGTGNSTSSEPWAFQSTHWSLVLTASQADSPQAQEALGKLCCLYWYPVYAFIRRQGYDPDQAKDLTQELFARIIEKRYLAAADREKGRFRSFLLTCAQHLLSNERKREHALKRGGEYSFVPLDDLVTESRYQAEPADGMSPEKLYERRWALALLDQALDQLQCEYVKAGKGAQFDVLQVFLSGAKEAPGSYADVCAQLKLSENAVRQAAYRMRCRFRELLQTVVAQTVASPAELESELSHLRTVLSQ
jgi:RNA polymerase sigma factor (sigma-70 family)